MRKLLYFLAFLIIACVACDSKNEPEVPPAPPTPKPDPISPRDSIDRLLEGIWEIDSVETFKYGRASQMYQFELIGYSKVKYTGNEYLKLDVGTLFRKEDKQDDYYGIGGWYGMKGDTAYVYSIKNNTSYYGGYITYQYSNRRTRIYKTEIKRASIYHKDSIISVHRRVKNYPSNFFYLKFQ